MIFASLQSLIVYQFQYDYAKARLDNPNDNHLVECGNLGNSLAHVVQYCKLELPQLDMAAVIAVAVGVPLVALGAIIAVREYARYEPQPPKLPEPPIGAFGAPFKL